MTLFDILGTILIGPLKLVFEMIFSVAYSVLSHPGLAIVVLSLAMNILLLPLYKRADAIQIEARDTENRLNPVVSHIKKTFSGDERMMILQTYYRQNNYSPLSVLKGSISLMLEIPFFMAAYQFLSHVSDFRGCAFGPITNLSLPDGLLVIGGITVNALPILMTLVNIISSSLYLKGFPLKTKIQLYGMAFFFLVFLYNSPSALVLYWTLNNLFSLVKNLFSRIKNSKALLRTLLAIAGIGAIGAGILMDGLLRSAFMICLGCGCQLPWLLPLVLKKFPSLQPRQKEVRPNTALFLSCGLFLTVLIGLLIPSTYVSASPQEYLDINYFYNPIWYVVYTCCLAAGTFLVWASVFYWLAKPRLKVLITRLMWIASGIMLVNYMFFGTNLGIVSSTLQFDNGLVFSSTEKLLNCAVVLVLFIGLWFVSRLSFRKIASIAMIGAIAMGCMSALNMGKILTSAKQVESRLDELRVPASYTLSQEGENVIVLFLDRAIGPLVPYIMEERPELKEQYDGFTYYPNTLSYGSATNFSSPSLYGGYEYTPVSLNQADTVPLAEKHNEALKVLPTIFSDAGYHVVLTAPPYANYQWLSDLSIYEGIENVDAYLEGGAYGNPTNLIQLVNSRKHNFFLFGIMKTMPVVLQPNIYTNGTYRTVATTSFANLQSNSTEFVSAFQGIQNLSTSTNITSDTQNQFLLLRSVITHEPTILQEPIFEYVADVDNSPYYPAEGRTITDGEHAHLLSTENSIAHYHINMAAFLQVGKFLDYLRANDVYDNSKIIIVSDHGHDIGVADSIEEGRHNIEFYLPLLMVKDFGATGFTVSDTFMTNADVPTLATSHFATTVYNPFTGNPINADDRNAQKHHVQISDIWDISINNGYQFLPSEWATVSGNVTVKENWVYHDGQSVLPPDL